MIMSCGLSVCLLGGYGAEAREASARANETERRAADAETKVQLIIDQLTDDERRVNQIPRDIDAANHDIRQARTQVPLAPPPGPLTKLGSLHSFHLPFLLRGWLSSRVVNVLDSSAEGPGFKLQVTCRLTAKDRDQLRNPMLGNRV